MKKKKKNASLVVIYPVLVLGCQSTFYFPTTHSVIQCLFLGVVDELQPITGDFGLNQLTPTFTSTVNLVFSVFLECERELLKKPGQAQGELVKSKDSKRKSQNFKADALSTCPPCCICCFMFKDFFSPRPQSETLSRMEPALINVSCSLYVRTRTGLSASFTLFF